MNTRMDGDNVKAVQNMLNMAVVLYALKSDQKIKS